MERDRLPLPDDVAPSAPAEGGSADASFLDSVMDLLDAQRPMADGAEFGRAEARLARKLREAIGARLRDAA